MTEIPTEPDISKEDGYMSDNADKVVISLVTFFLVINSTWQIWAPKIALLLHQHTNCPSLKHLFQTVQSMPMHPLPVTKLHQAPTFLLCLLQIHLHWIEGGCWHIYFTVCPLFPPFHMSSLVHLASSS